MGVDEAGTVPEGYFDAANQHVTHLQIVVSVEPLSRSFRQLQREELPFWIVRDSPPYRPRGRYLQEVLIQHTGTKLLFGLL